jgi:predicted  nucleic acid-binding Zn-ribbon protein
MSEPTMSQFATQADYWKDRAERTERALAAAEREREEHESLKAYAAEVLQPRINELEAALRAAESASAALREATRPIVAHWAALHDALYESEISSTLESLAHNMTAAVDALRALAGKEAT